MRVVIGDKKCKECKAPFTQYNSTQNLCFDCTRAKFLAAPQKKRKSVRRVGKVTERWMEFRREWIASHTPASGQWVCALQISPQCLRTMTLDTLTLDHIVGRGRASQLRYNEGNIQPACSFCNGQKGSSAL